MRLIKLGVISVVVMFVVIYLLSLLIPSHSIVSRAITIDVPMDSVKIKLNDLRQWESWNALLRDSSLGKINFQEKSVQSGRMNIELVSADSGLIKTRWKRGGQDAVVSTHSLTQAGNATIVQWYFDFKLKWYPWEKFGSIVFDNEIGPPMEASLEQLKKLCEKQTE